MENTKEKVENMQKNMSGKTSGNDSENISPNNSNVSITKERPKNLFELKKAISECDTIISRGERPTVELYGYIARGIEIKEQELKNTIMKSICLFLFQYGYSEEFVLNKLKHLSFCTTYLKEGLAKSNLNSIVLDCSLLNFDERTGEYISIKDEKKSYVSYLICHEFYHNLSSMYDDRNVVTNEDVYSEGITDMLAMLTMGNYGNGCKNYDFSAKVCSFFTEIIGMNKILEDHFNSISTVPNLTKLFEECGLVDKFSLVRDMFSSTINGNDNDIRVSLEFLENEFLVAYYKRYPDNADRIRIVFDNLFSGYFLKYGHKTL